MADYRVGFFIAGGSGAGKTSTCLLVAEAIQNVELNQEDYARFKNPEVLEAIALDTHAHDPSNARGWDLLGVKAVWQPMAVLKQLDYLEEEFRARKAGRKGNRILVLFDEYGETYKDMRTLLLEDEKNSDAYIKRKLTRKSDFIVSLATGGSRKFGIIPVIMNQTWNCVKLKMDASERNNFIGIYLNKLADTYAINAKITDKEILQDLEDNKDNYRALISGAVPDSFMPHPAFPGKPLSQKGVPPEYQPQVTLHEPSIKIVDWGVRESNSPKRTTDSSRQGNSPQIVRDSPESVDYSKTSDSKGSSTPLCEKSANSLEAVFQAESTDEGVRLEKIRDFWLAGETRLTVIIPVVWADFPGADKISSRAYKKCREEYRRLTGK